MRERRVMTSQWIFVIILILSGEINAKAAKLTHEELATCDSLEKALGDFLTGISYHYNVIYNLMDYHLAVGKEELDYLRSKSGLDLRDPRDMRRLACALTGVKTKRDLAALFALPEKEVNRFYEVLLAPVDDVGGVRNLQELADVYIELLSWAIRNKYPIIPLDIDPRDTKETFERIDKHMKKDFILRHTRNLPFPVNLRPMQAVVLLEDVETYADLSIGMEQPEELFRNWASWLKQDPKALPSAITDIQVTMAFLKALDQAGLLHLK